MRHDVTGPVNVLLVDDSATFLDAAKAFIETQPSLRLVGTARDGAEALARLDGAEASLVLMDAVMPVLDGFEATRRIKATKESPVVILMSVHETTAVEQEAWAAGADAFLPKSEFSDRLPGVILEIFGGGRRPIAANASQQHSSGPSTPRRAERSQQSTVMQSVLDRILAMIGRLGRSQRPSSETLGSTNA